MEMRGVWRASHAMCVVFGLPGWGGCLPPYPHPRSTPRSVLAARVLQGTHAVPSRHRGRGALSHASP
ncbi:hypothetical protein FDU21_19925 [Xanthomonas oryzae pv. oryzae]|nr:hypothetical protein FDU21_19925 [Xanthomonas oryzae pv. oryzae]